MALLLLYTELSACKHLLALQPFNRSEIIGFTIGSISSVLYLCSRVPQIYTNVSVTAERGSMGIPGALTFQPMGSSVSSLHRVARSPSLVICFSVLLLQNLIPFSPLPVTGQSLEGEAFVLSFFMSTKGTKRL